MNPLWTRHRLRAVVVDINEETSDARTLTLKPGNGWRPHRAGQHLEVCVPIDGRLHRRRFSLSSAPETSDGRVTITVKAIPHGVVSNYLTRKTKVGDVLGVSPPAGEFTLPESAPVHPLFITAGSGITPVMAMLSDLRTRENAPATVHIHFAPTEADVIFGRELLDMAGSGGNFDYQSHLIFTRHGGAACKAKTRFCAEQLDTLCPDWRQRDVYACGPAKLLHQLEEHWESHGLRHRLHIERFKAALAEPPEYGSGGQVRFHSSGATIRAEASKSLLQVAESSGLDLPYGCRMGICHSCTRELVAGQVRDLRTNSVIREPGSRIQICVCAAQGDCELT